MDFLSFDKFLYLNKFRDPLSKIICTSLTEKLMFHQSVPQFTHTHYPTLGVSVRIMSI